MLSERINLRFALFEPDIPQNLGTILRLAACLGFGTDIIEPCGFPLSHAKLKRAGMDYLDHVEMLQHHSWESFHGSCYGQARRLLLLTTKSKVSYLEQKFAPGDTLLLGRETAGVPTFVHEAADARLTVPMLSGMRSLNVAVAAAMVAGEALRQLSQYR